MRLKRIPFLVIPLLLTCCTPPASPEPTNTPTVIPATEEDSIIVSSTSNSGPGSLRQALLEAQYGDTITFDTTVFPPDAPAIIFITNEELPGINVDNLTLDASNAGVILDGNQLQGDWVAGLQIISSRDVSIMGLQISHFPGPGIAISGDSTQNIIGGNRRIGEGPWGQGNLLSNNNVGVSITSPQALLNTITGNLIGTDLKGSHWLGNDDFGVKVWEGARENKVGTDNIIAYNGRGGVYLESRVSDQNTIIDNDIFGNAIGIGWPESPALFDYDLVEGTVVGATCPSCRVEIYSASNYWEELEGALLEGEITADKNGIFSFDKGKLFNGPHLTARTLSLIHI